jgi:hypothetical protein
MLKFNSVAYTFQLPTSIYEVGEIVFARQPAKGTKVLRDRNIAALTVEQNTAADK